MRDYARHTPSALRARPPILEGQFLQVVNKKNRVKHDIYRHIIILLLVLVAPLLSPQGGKTAMPEYSPLGEIEGAAIVESEKTAIIMSLIKPDTVWLATGGKANFKEQMLAPLIGLEVAVYPDADALHDWYTRAVEMNRPLGTRLHIPTGYYNLMDHDESRREGWDFADILLREEGKYFRV